MWAPHAADTLTSVFHLETETSAPSALVAGQYLGPAPALPRLLRPLTASGGTLGDGEENYLALQRRWAGCAGASLQSCHTVGTAPGGTLPRADFAGKSDFVNRPLSATARGLLTRAIERKEGQPGSCAILFDSHGGAINRVAPEATAFVHRSALCCMQYLAHNGGESWLAATHAQMRPYVSGSAYQNYIDPILRDWQRAYYGANYPRLVAIQRRVDPHHFFRFAQPVGA